MVVSAGKLHADEVEIDAGLVGRLVASQFPRWAHLPIRPVRSAGTDHAIYRLGDDLAVRLPRVPSAAPQVDKERRWLPRLAPRLPLPIPVPLARGAPGEGYPWGWSVCRWLEGENATLERLHDLDRAARDLARFITALQRIASSGGPLPGTHNFFRGVPLARRDAGTRDAIAALRGTLDAGAATAAWEAALRVPAWDRPPVWVHGDLQSGNLIAARGRLSAVIDFGGLCVGDPACDLMVAWNLFPAETRKVFRAALSVGDATWARGRGWALSVALVGLPYYQHTSPAIAEASRCTIAEVLAEHRGAP